MIKIQQTFKNESPTIYLVTTPIGNLEDMSFRGIEILKMVDIIYCEDTRTSAVLLNKYNIVTKTKSLHKFNEIEKIGEIKTNLNMGQNLAIISDAGVPCINDPGLYMLEKLLEGDLNFNISVVGAGPAYVHALVGSGYFFDKHAYLGFLPKKETQIERELSNLNLLLNKNETISIAFYESVHRIKKTFEAIQKYMKNSFFKIAIARELTKKNEEFIRLTSDDLNVFLNSDLLIEKGEFCVILNFKPQIQKQPISESDLIKKAHNLIKIGMRKKEALKELLTEYDFDIEALYKKI